MAVAVRAETETSAEAVAAACAEATATAEPAAVAVAAATATAEALAAATAEDMLWILFHRRINFVYYFKFSLLSNEFCLLSNDLVHTIHISYSKLPQGVKALKTTTTEL